MKKVAYSLRKTNDWNSKKSGIGYISDSGEDLIIYPDTRFERIYEDCIRYCYSIINKKNEFKGTFYEFNEVDFDVIKDTDFISVETKEIETQYNLWFKLLD